MGSEAAIYQHYGVLNAVGGWKDVPLVDDAFVLAVVVIGD